VQVGIKLYFSQFIFIFDLVSGFLFLLFWTDIETKYGNKSFAISYTFSEEKAR